MNVVDLGKLIAAIRFKKWHKATNKWPNLVTLQPIPI